MKTQLIQMVEGPSQEMDMMGLSDVLDVFHNIGTLISHPRLEIRLVENIGYTAKFRINPHPIFTDWLDTTLMDIDKSLESFKTARALHCAGYDDGCECRRDEVNRFVEFVEPILYSLKDLRPEFEKYLSGESLFLQFDWS